jgi:hypothetical protein
MRRLLWIVNHKTLLQAEVPILRSLGWEVFVPKILPHHDPGFRSAATSYEFDSALGLPPATLAVLNCHNFIERGWPPTVAEIVNKLAGCEFQAPQKCLRLMSVYPISFMP